MAKGRFSKLELETEKQEQKQQIKKHFVNQDRDEHYYFKQAEEMILSGEHDKALRSYAAALGENPLALDGWVGQVRMLIELEEYPEAGLWSDKALEKFPDNPQLLAVKSVALYRQGKHNQARSLNDVALQAKGEFYLVWLCRGEIMLAYNSKVSEECFKHALKLPSDKKELIELFIGVIYLRHKKYCNALLYLQKSAVNLPRSAWSWYLLGEVQVSLGQFSQASISFKQAKDLCPYHELYKNAYKKIPRGFVGLLKRIWSSFKSY